MQRVGSRRRRPSRSAATSPRRQSVVSSQETTMPPSRATARRASIATPETSPRNSSCEFVTVTAADDGESDPEITLEVYDRSPRGSLAPGFSRSPRNSLVPNEYRQNNLLDPGSGYVRTPRGSLVPEPDQYRSSRTSLIPDECIHYSRSPRNSLVPDYNRSPRNSLVPDPNNRTHRKSLVPESAMPRSPRGSLVPGDNSRSPRGSIAETTAGRSPRGSIAGIEGSRSPRGSLIPESSRSPRGSIASEHSYNRSPRNSLPSTGRSPRGSIGSTGASHEPNRSPRGSVDLPTGGCRGRSGSPYKGGCRGGGQGVTAQDSVGSRRASSSVSQLCPLDGVKAILIGPAYVSSHVAKVAHHAVSTDDRRHLCEQTKLNPEAATGFTTYGSVVYQLNHANMESNSLCDFIVRGIGIIYRTIVVTVVLVCLSALPMVMFILGLQFVRDCPKEPRIPVYMIVGGVLGTVKLGWSVWSQVRSRRFEARRHDATATTQDGVGSRVADFLLSGFLVLWFVLGNAWILGIYWPEFEPTRYDPNRWCSQTLYIFSLVHLVIVYSVFGLFIITVIVLASCQICFCRILDCK